MYSILRHLTRNWLVYIVFLVAIPALGVWIEDKEGKGTLVIALFSAIITTQGAILIDTYVVPKPYRSIRKKISQADNVASTHPIMQRHYLDGISNTEKDLDEICSRRFSARVFQVPDMSIFAMNLVDMKCILTFPLSESEAFLTPDHGPAFRYYQAMIASSKAMQSKGLDGITRIFILKGDAEIGSNLLRFIQKNIRDGIGVRIILEDELPPRDISIESNDFGIFETATDHKWVMILKESDRNRSLIEYIVDIDRRRIPLYFEYIGEILRKSRTYEDFLATVFKPVNGEFWSPYFAESGFEMPPPHGLSDEDADYIVEAAARKVESIGDASILILGFTPKLLRRLISKGINKVVSIDQLGNKPMEFQNRAKFLTGNWLDFTSEDKFDSIVFDESINNLSRIQLGFFFPCMAALLKPRRTLVGRVMGRFDEDLMAKYGDVSLKDAIEILRKIKGRCHNDYAPQIICLLHSTKIAYSTNNMYIDCDRWDASLADLRKDGSITEQEYKDWRLHFDFKILSPDRDTLLAESRSSNLILSEMRSIQGAYAGLCEDTSGFFKLYNFEYIKDN